MLVMQLGSGAADLTGPAREECACIFLSIRQQKALLASTTTLSPYSVQSCCRQGNNTQAAAGLAALSTQPNGGQLLQQILGKLLSQNNEQANQNLGKVLRKRPTGCRFLHPVPHQTPAQPGQRSLSSR